MKETSITQGAAKRIIAVMVCAVLLCSMLWTTRAADTSKDVTNYDVVFVLDNSYSMKTSDPHSLLRQATELFINMAPTEGTRFGAVVYAYEEKDTKEQHVSTHDLTSDADEINRFVKKALTYSYRGTDIPLGLGKADELLQRSGNPENKKAIILLTDGNNDFHARSQSQLDKDINNLLDESKDYQIYAIGLDYDKDAPVNASYLRGISSPIKGFPIIISEDSQIKDAFDKIINDMFDFDTVDIDPNGYFEIENEEIVEAVLDISGSGRPQWTLTDPYGNTYTSAGGDISVKETDNYTDITIFNPAVGKWRITYPQSNKFSRKCLLSYNVSIDVGVTPGDGGTKDTYTFNVQVYNSQTQITQSASFFERFACHAEVFLSDGKKDGELDLTAFADGYTGTYTPKSGKIDTYSVRCTLTGSRLNKTSPEATFNITQKGMIHGNSTSQNPKQGMPWWVWVLIGVCALSIATAVVIIIKKIRNKNKNRNLLSGIIKYSWFNEDDFTYNTSPTNTWDLNYPRVCERTIADLMNHDPRFSVLTGVAMVGMRNDWGQMVNGIVNRDENVQVVMAGMTIGAVPQIIQANQSVIISFKDANGTNMRLEFEI